MERKDLLKIITNQNYGKYEISGYTLKYNQLIPNNFLTVSAPTSTIPTTNKCGSYITIISPGSHIGHKVFAKVITDNNKIKCCWYKTGTTAYDFATGLPLNISSTPTNRFTGIYELTNDMVYSDGYLQLYWWVYANLPTGTHTITIQLVDLTQIYGAGNEPTRVSDFLAKYPIFNRDTPVNYTTLSLISATTPYIFTKSVLPNEYEELESIETSNISSTNQFINTGLNIDFNDKVILEFEMKELGSYCCIYGASGDNYLTINASNQLGFAIGLTGYTDLIEIETGKSYKMEIVFGNNDINIKINDTTLSYHRETAYYKQTKDIYLFANNVSDNAQNYAKMKLKTFKVERNGAYIIDLRPAKDKSDNEIGLYDIVSQTFYQNDGTGAFVGGNVSSKTFIYAPISPLSLKGILTSKDTFLTYNGYMTGIIGTRAYRSGDENDPTVITNGTFTYYIQAEPGHAYFPNIRLPKGITSVIDTNGVELEFVEK